MHTTLIRVPSSRNSRRSASKETGSTRRSDIQVADGRHQVLNERAEVVSTIQAADHSAKTIGGSYLRARPTLRYAPSCDDDDGVMAHFAPKGALDRIRDRNCRFLMEEAVSLQNLNRVPGSSSGPRLGTFSSPCHFSAVTSNYQGSINY